MRLRQLILSTSAAALLGSAAMAGGVAEPVMDPVVVAEETSSSGGGIIVPLLLLVLVAAALAGSNGGAAPTVNLSDRRVKTDVNWVGMARGLPVYQYRYIGSATRFEGVMAQDVLGLMPEAVITQSNGLMAVNYDILGIKMKVLH